MDLAKIGDKVTCSCKGGPHRIVSGVSMAQVDGIPIVGELLEMEREELIRQFLP